MEGNCLQLHSSGKAELARWQEKALTNEAEAHTHFCAQSSACTKAGLVNCVGLWLKLLGVSQELCVSLLSGLLASSDSCF